MRTQSEKINWLGRRKSWQVTADESLMRNQRALGFGTSICGKPPRTLKNLGFRDTDAFHARMTAAESWVTIPFSSSDSRHEPCGVGLTTRRWLYLDSLTP